MASFLCEHAAPMREHFNATRLGGPGTARTFCGLDLGWAQNGMQEGGFWYVPDGEAELGVTCAVCARHASLLAVNEAIQGVASDL